jgi:hypothetical protein
VPWDAQPRNLSLENQRLAAESNPWTEVRAYSRMRNKAGMWDRGGPCNPVPIVPHNPLASLSPNRLYSIQIERSACFRSIIDGHGVWAGGTVSTTKAAKEHEEAMV